MLLFHFASIYVYVTKYLFASCYSIFIEMVSAISVVVLLFFLWILFLLFFRMDGYTILIQHFFFFVFFYFSEGRLSLFYWETLQQKISSSHIWISHSKFSEYIQRRCYSHAFRYIHIESKSNTYISCNTVCSLITVA